MKDLTVGKEGKLIFQFAIPMLLGNVFHQLYNVADSIIVGRFLGKEALAAVGASFPLIFLLVSLIIGFSMGLTIIISQYYGAKDFDKIKKAIDTLNIVMLVASVLMTALSMWLSEPIFSLMNIPAEVRPDASIYFNTYMLGTIFTFGFNGITAVLRGLGDSKTPLYFLIVSNILNIVFSIGLVVYAGLGVQGAAIATIAAQAITFFSAVIYINKTHKLISISYHRYNFNKEIFIQSIKIGLPSGLHFIFISLGMIVFFSIVNQYGTSVAAAYAGAVRIDSLASLPAMNFSMALSAFVGQNIGANKMERVKAGFFSTLKVTSAISITVSVIVIFFGDYMMQLFTTDTNVMAIGHDYLITVCSFYIIFTSMFVIGAVMRGAGDTLAPMLISLFAIIVIRLPLAFILSEHFGEKGVWWSIPIAWTIGLIASGIYYSTGKWKTKSLIKRK